jgi:uncharacterized protein (TIGR03083 family)
MIKREFLEKLNRERAKVLNAVEGLSDEQMSREPADGKWSIKDILGHITAWEAEAVRAFEQKARGERPTIMSITDIEAWNQVEAGKRKGASVAEIRNELNETRNRLLEIVNTLPDDGDLWSPERSTAKILNMLIEHDDHHSKAIEQQRQSFGS